MCHLCVLLLFFFYFHKTVSGNKFNSSATLKTVHENLLWLKKTTADYIQEAVSVVVVAIYTVYIS